MKLYAIATAGVAGAILLSGAGLFTHGYQVGNRCSVANQEAVSHFNQAASMVDRATNILRQGDAFRFNYLAQRAVDKMEESGSINRARWAACSGVFDSPLTPVYTMFVEVDYTHVGEAEGRLETSIQNMNRAARRFSFF
ncbi:hypothetical protein [Synechococcus phage S-H34]|uniref:Uncharacterized protein n=1 Tax=Synechococcus phage S-H34 TaxID=2718942 RepID=A0A6G8R6F2_9CAUD|nr:hypothetical protein PQC15_gp093 [Synechococcus phage S-H34]QIN96964.1 hypothetical protein [Synechococcus phage S-H34]